MTNGPSPFRRLRGERATRECARMMAGSEPWLTLGRGLDDCLRLLRDPSREVHVAVQDGRVTGFVVLCMTGAFVGYLQTICVHEDFRGQGLGTELVRLAEARIFEVSPNVFMCVSSFNRGARRLYRRLGYRQVGRLKDYVVAGHDELLLRKTRGPLQGWPRVRRTVPR